MIPVCPEYLLCLICAHLIGETDDKPFSIAWLLASTYESFADGDIGFWQAWLRPLGNVNVFCLIPYLFFVCNVLSL